MDDLLRDLAAHGIRDRRIALIENGSWAPSAAKCMREILTPLKGIEFLCDDISFRSAMHTDTNRSIDTLAEMIASTI